MSDEYALPNALLRYFDLSSSPYADDAESIKERRRSYPEGKLFFDRLLEIASVDALYPPTSPSAVRRLLHAIHTAQVDRIKRDCFIYYLIRDADAASRPANGSMDVDTASDVDEASRATEFARRRVLPRTWRTLMDGYWALDHGDWTEGVENLTNPAITEINFVPAIVEALATLVSPPAQALELVNELLGGAEPSSQPEADAKLLATASVGGMNAAFRHIRHLPDASARKAARESVWCWSLGAPRSLAGKGAHTAQPRALRELLHLALTDEENAHLVRFLAHPPRQIEPPARSLLHDLVTLRLVHAGQYEETLALDKELAATDAASASDRQRRREMVREFIDILPDAQRRILLGADYARGASAVNGPTANGDDVDMSSSWVEVEPVKDIEVDEAPAPVQAPSTPRPVAPTPIRAPALRALAGETPRAGTSSPFGGPPRFASPRPASPRPATPSTAPRAPSPEQDMPAPLPPALRQTSPPRHNNSPFNPPPPTASTSRAKTPRRPKKIIVDDEAPVRRSSRRRSAPDSPESTTTSATATPHGATLRAPSEPPIPEDAPVPPVDEPRRTRGGAKHDRKPTKTPVRRSARRATATPEPHADEDEEPDIPGSFAKARVTRSAARAHLDDGESSAPKRTRGATAERRVTRAMSEATVSERGSPTPSVASEMGSPKKRGRGGRARGTSATPRATRSRK